MRENLVALVQLVLQLVSFLILARVLLSWVQVDRSNQAVQLIYNLTEPILEPIRRLLPQVGMFDFSPIVAMLLLQILVEPVLIALIRSLF